MTERVCVILGGGGHARVVLDSLQGAPEVRVCGILDPNRQLWGTDMLGVRVLGGDELLEQLARDGASCFTIGLGSVGDSQPRRRLFAFGRQFGLEPLTVVHPRATLSRWATIGAGSHLLPGAIVNAGADVGMNVIVNSGAIVEHDCRVGDHAHIATGARLASTVRVGEGAHVGAGATVRQGIAIGAEAVVGAGAVVVADVPAGQTVVGVPARVLVRSS